MKADLVIEFSAVTVESSHHGGASVQEVDWQVRRGESWVIGGLQGSGKTAVLEAAAGLRATIEGSLRLFGELVAELRPKEARALRRRLGLVFEGSGRLLGGLNVLENLTLPLCYHQNLTMSDAADAVAPLIDSLDLKGVVSHRPGRLGYGTAKRVALARALVLRPEVLLVDDPLGGLDAAQARMIRRLLQQLRAGHPWMEGRPLTLVVTAEELRPVLSLGQRFAVVERRIWRVVGGREDLLNSTAPEVAELLMDTPEPFLE